MNAVGKACLILVMGVALWPALVSAKPPAPAGTLVYEDNFSDPKKSGLEDNLNATDYSRGFHAPGVYHLILLQANDTRWVLFPNKTFNSLTVEADIWDNSDDFKGDVTQGIVFRAQDNTHLYAALIDPRKGQYAVRKLNGTAWSDLIAWKPSPLIKQKSDVNHIRIDAAGDTFTLYLNDELLDSVRDAAYPAGGLGFIAVNVDASKPHMHFDNVKLYTADAQPVTLPGTGAAAALLPLWLIGFGLALLGCGALLRRRA